MLNIAIREIKIKTTVRFHLWEEWLSLRKKMTKMMAKGGNQIIKTIFCYST